MIHCKKCGNTRIKTKVDSVFMVGQVTVPGEKEVEAYKELDHDVGPKISNFELRGSVCSDIETIGELICEECNTIGTIGEEFIVHDLCRCGSTREFWACHYYETIVCDGCRNFDVCSRCTFTCKINDPESSRSPEPPTNNTSESRSSSTRQARARINPARIDFERIADIASRRG
jgi:hypothetical protein